MSITVNKTAEKFHRAAVLILLSFKNVHFLKILHLQETFSTVVKLV